MNDTEKQELLALADEVSAQGRYDWAVRLRREVRRALYVEAREAGIPTDEVVQWAQKRLEELSAGINQQLRMI
jgi:hypothetical protein